MNGILLLLILYPRLRIQLIQAVMLKICVGGMKNFPKGGGKLPPPFL